MKSTYSLRSQGNFLLPEIGASRSPPVKSSLLKQAGSSLLTLTPSKPIGKADDLPRGMSSGTDFSAGKGQPFTSESQKAYSPGVENSYGRGPNTREQLSRPQSVTCYLCGRDFGTASIEIHLKTCKKKWEQEQSVKPNLQRRLTPVQPQNFEQVIQAAKNGDKVNLEAINSESF